MALNITKNISMVYLFICTFFYFLFFIVKFGLTHPDPVVESR